MPRKKGTPRRKGPNVRPKKEHTEEFIATRTAQMEIMDRAIALKKLAYPLRLLIKGNRMKKESREERMRRTIERFGNEEALDKQFDACRMSMQAYYDARRMIRQGVGLEGTWPTGEEVAERVLLEKYDEIYEEMKKLELESIERSGSAGYQSEVGMYERVSDLADDILKNSKNKKGEL